ncbi:MAG: hypothetical protein R3E64_09825 [Halioglobus sp.]
MLASTRQFVLHFSDKKEGSDRKLLIILSWYSYCVIQPKQIPGAESVIIMNRHIFALLSLLCLCLGGLVHAASIDPNNPAEVLESRGLSREDNRHVTAPLVDFSPFSANDGTAVPGFADPLGTGIDPGLKIFSGKVHFMDLLGNFDVAKEEAADEIEIPANALQGINLLDNFLALYLSYNGRAYDASLLTIGGAEVIERNGLPVTRETSPLSLAGFGNVSDNFRPISMHWTRCPAREKRVHKMTESMNKNRSPCAVPAVCQCYEI